MDLACPKCTSTEVRKLSLIYNEGLSMVNTVSHGSGAAFGSGGGMAFGSTSTSTTGRQQTALSQQGLGTLVGLGLTILAVRFAISGRQFNYGVHPGLMQKWDQSFMCNRCGAHFVAA